MNNGKGSNIEQLLEVLGETHVSTPDNWTHRRSMTVGCRATDQVKTIKATTGILAGLNRNNYTLKMFRVMNWKIWSLISSFVSKIHHIHWSMKSLEHQLTSLNYSEMEFCASRKRRTEVFEEWWNLDWTTDKDSVMNIAVVLWIESKHNCSNG